MSRTGILIITHNSAGHIEACLDAVNQVRGPEDIVLVIDNGSSDDITSAVQTHARLVKNKYNAGFAGAVNQGFQALRNEVDHILLLNPDVVLRGEGSLQQLTAACHQSGLACGRLMDANGSTQIGFSFRRLPAPLTLLFETIGLNKLWKSNPVNRRYRCLDVDHSVAQYVEQPAGAMLMVRCDVWSSLGGFDDQFHPVWFEDVDFCRRALLAGYHAAYVPGVEGIHAGGHSVSQISNRNRKQYWYASLLRYSRKHFERGGRGLVAGGVALAGVARALLAAFQLHDGSLKEAGMNLMIARTAFVYPRSKPFLKGLDEIECADETDVGCRVSNEGNSSNENTERTLKRLHAR